MRQLLALQNGGDDVGVDMGVVALDPHTNGLQLEDEVLVGDPHHSREVLDPNFSHNRDDSLSPGSASTSLRSDSTPAERAYSASFFPSSGAASPPSFSAPSSSLPERWACVARWASLSWNARLRAAIKSSSAIELGVSGRRKVLPMSA